MSAHHELAIRQLSPFPLCFLSSLVAPSSTPALASGLSSSEFPYRWERVCAFLVLVADLWPAGFLGSQKDRRPLAFMPGRALPTSSPSDDSFPGNVPLSVEVSSDGPYVLVGSIRLSRIAGTGRIWRILLGSVWLCRVGVQHHRRYHSPSLERPARSFGSLPLRTFCCHR